jgi:hypothetical protein
MGLPQLIAFSPLEALFWLVKAPAHRLPQWLLESATWRAGARAGRCGLYSSFRSQSAAVPRPATPSAQRRGAPLRFPTTLSQPQTRGWSENFGVHNKEEWVGRGWKVKS